MLYAARFILTSYVDRWHPVAMLAEAAGRPDLLESAIALNGAASTAEYILRHGPVRITAPPDAPTRLDPGDGQLLAPLQLLKPLARLTQDRQRRAVAALVSQTSATGETGDLPAAISDDWQRFQKHMQAFHHAAGTPASDIAALAAPATLPELLARVEREVWLALRADFAAKLATALDSLGEQAHFVVDAQLRSAKSYGTKADGTGPAIITRSRLLARTLDSLYQPQVMPEADWAKAVIRLAWGAKTALTVGVTATPEFALKNLLRDWLTAYALGRHCRGLIANLGSVASYAAHDSMKREWLLNGGSFGSFYDQTFESQRPERPSTTTLAKKGMLGALGRLWRLYTAPMRAADSASRLSQFRAMRANGATPRQAVTAARLVATDFTDRGASDLWWRFALTVPFLNAAIQGLNQARKVFFTGTGTGGATIGPWHPARRASHSFSSLVRACTLALIPATALAWNAADPERLAKYEAQPAHEKARWVYVYDSAGRDWRIPVPFELGAVFMKLPEMVLDRAFGLRTVDTANIVPGRIAATPAMLLETTVMLEFTPALIGPALDVLRNRKFTGQPIVPHWMQNRPRQAQRYAWTPTLASATAAMLPGVGPLQAEVLLRGHLGHMASLAMAGIDELTRDRAKHGAEPFPEFWYRLSGQRAVLRKGPYYSTRHTIELRDFADVTGREAWKCKNRWPCDRQMARLASRLSDRQDALRKMTSRNNAIETAAKLSRHDKEERLLRMYGRRNAAAARVHGQLLKAGY